MKLPQEIQDLIFLKLDYKTLKNTRELQSDYVKKRTEYYTFACAAQNGNLDNMKWLKENNCPWDSYTFERAALNGNLDNMKWLNPLTTTTFFKISLFLSFFKITIIKWS